MTKSEGAKVDLNDIGGFGVDVWNKRWRLIEHGFHVHQPQLRDRVGLFAAKSGDEFRYIGQATTAQGPGLSAGLARAYVQNPSGDGGYGMKMLRQHREELEAFVIDLARSAENIEVVKQLKRAMMKVHDPVWNRPDPIVAAARQKAYNDRSKS